MSTGTQWPHQRESMTIFQMLPAHVSRTFATAPSGLVTLRHLAGMGFDRRQVSAWTTQRELKRVLHGVYTLGGDAPDHALHLLQLPQVYIPLRAREGDSPPVVSGKPVLALYGADGFDVTSRPLVLVDAHCRVRAEPKPFELCRVDMTAVEWEWTKGIRTAAPWRALCDTALDPGVTDRQLRVAADALRNRRILGVTRAVTHWAALNPHPGARRLLQMVDEGQFEQESEGERAAFALLFGHGGPLPDCQVHPLGRLRVDFVFLHAALIIEYYGKDHDATADADATRIDAFEQLGYRVIVVTKSMLKRALVVRARIERIRQDRLQRALAGTLPLPPLPPQPPRLVPLRTILPNRSELGRAA